ncbi:MAG: hypothetical protein ACFE8P_16440, partial [Promethearchaeota archaeon]
KNLVGNRKKTILPGIKVSTVLPIPIRETDKNITLDLNFTFPEKNLNKKIVAMIQLMKIV